MLLSVKSTEYGEWKQQNTYIDTSYPVYQIDEKQMNIVTIMKRMNRNSFFTSF